MLPPRLSCDGNWQQLAASLRLVIVGMGLLVVCSFSLVSLVVKMDIRFCEVGRYNSTLWAVFVNLLT